MTNDEVPNDEDPRAAQRVGRALPAVPVRRVCRWVFYEQLRPFACLSALLRVRGPVAVLLEALEIVPLCVPC